MTLAVKLFGPAVPGVAVRAIRTEVAKSLPSTWTLGGAGGWRGLLDSPYGRFLDVKVALFAGLVLLGALNRFRVVPALAAGVRRLDRLRRNVRAEVILAACILAVTAMLGLGTSWRGIAGLTNAHWSELRRNPSGVEPGWRLFGHDLGPSTSIAEWNAGTALDAAPGLAPEVGAPA